MRPSQGDIVLVQVPFTDLTTAQRRPVIVISNDTYHASTQDFVCVAMTSNLTPSPYSFDISAADLSAGTLNRPSRVRVDKVYTLAQGTIVAIFGRVRPDVLDNIRQLRADLC